MTREASGFVKLNVDGHGPRRFQEEDIAIAEPSGRKGALQLLLSDNFQRPDLHAPGGRDVAVQRQQEKVRRLSGPVLFRPGRFEPHPLCSQGLKYLIPVKRGKRKKQNGSSLP